MGKNKKNPDHKFTLYIKLSRRIPNSININDSVREMFPDVANVRKPRQKSCRWLLVDFEVNEKAEEFKKMLFEKKEIAKIKVKTQKLTIKDNSVNLDDSSNDRQQYINSLTKQTFQSKSLEKYSNKLLVTNLPETVTKTELVELFPHHLSIDCTSPKVRAIISYSSVKEAMAARMQVRPQLLNGQKIRVILLLLEDETRKQKPVAAETSKTGAKKQKKEPHKFIKPLRYFENDVE